jgi:hypothetical protein
VRLECDTYCLELQIEAKATESSGAVLLESNL